MYTLILDRHLNFFRGGLSLFDGISYGLSLVFQGGGVCCLSVD